MDVDGRGLVSLTDTGLKTHVILVGLALELEREIAQTETETETEPKSRHQQSTCSRANHRLAC